MKPAFFVATLVFILLLSIGAMAGEEQAAWVTAEGLAPIFDDDVQSAKKLAMQLARLQAIRKSMCPDITAESLLVNLRLSGSLSGSIPHCHISKTKVIADGADIATINQNNKLAPLNYRLQLKASVVEAGTKADAKFRLDARLNHTRFYEGEEMVIRVVATIPAYCYIYVILEDGHTIQLMPNRFATHKQIGPGQTLMFPDADEINKGIRLKTQLPDGHNVTTEMVYIVALKASAKYPSGKNEALMTRPYEGDTGRFEQLIATIATIPANERCETIIPYQIVKKKP